jgi:hypothetical protein
MNISKQLDVIFGNKTFSTVVSLLLALYAGLAAPALPNSVVLFFDTWFGKIFFMFLIGYVASKNVQVALMIAVAFVITLHIANKRVTELFVNRETFESVMEQFEIHEGVKKALCDWVKTLDEVSSPKRSEVEIKDSATALREYSDFLVKQDANITPELIMEVAESKDLSGKKVSDICKEVDTAPSTTVPTDSSSKTAESFSGNEYFENMVNDVVPADNLDGRTDKMYAPVDF